ncbi:MAPEG family protein [Oceaniglobus roseus]|uniref:MAPEG family protein n=1 Tax=Oceaniglobus roseus TaxID=1737570 RepID=UPI000C7F4A11|nr:MAPEG family protein [Kandeliimicrobium roseum]
MTAELAWLLATALLGASLWIPYIVGVNTSPVDTTDFTRPADPAVHAAWVHRAWRAHLNLLEQMMPFAVVVLIAHAAGVSNAVTVWTCTAFFWIRVIHAAGMISGLAVFPIRPIIFTLGWLCILILALQVLLAA